MVDKTALIRHIDVDIILDVDDSFVGWFRLGGEFRTARGEEQAVLHARRGSYSGLAKGRMV